MPSLSYTTAAVDDLRAIADFIAEGSGSEDVAEAFVMQLDGRCQRLAALPGRLGTARVELRADLRSIPHKGYIIFFRYVGNLVEIVNILHGSRDVLTHFRVGSED